MTTVTITEGGQIAIPEETLKKMRVSVGDRLDLELLENGKLLVHPQNGSIMDLKGCIPWSGRTVTIEEMNDAIATGAAKSLGVTPYPNRKSST